MEGKCLISEIQLWGWMEVILGKGDAVDSWSLSSQVEWPPVEILVNWKHFKHEPVTILIGIQFLILPILLGTFLCKRHSEKQINPKMGIDKDKRGICSLHHSEWVLNTCLLFPILVLLSSAL